MPKKVLVLDNDPRILEIMEEVLCYEGFTVKTFEETNDIISEIKAFQPDVFITDFFLNGTTGGELCKKIKSTKDTAHIPVIIFSAYAKVSESLDHYACDAYVPKPFDLTEMLDLIKNLSEKQYKIRINTPVIGY